MIEKSDLIVIGAGPAGAAAALEASRHGMRVTLIDESPQAGGQIWRAPNFPHAPADADAQAGETLRRDIAASNVIWRPGRRVWAVTGQFRVDCTGAASGESFEAPMLLAATGAYERVVPFPGWTLPGVIGLAAATSLMKAEMIAPGRRLVVAGVGPLLFAVAAKARSLGAEIVAVVDRSAMSDWLRVLPDLAGRPGMILQGVRWISQLRAAGIPILSRSTVVAGNGADRLESVTVARCDRDGIPDAATSRILPADALAVGHGLTPGGDVTRLLRAEHRFVRERGGWVPVLDADFRTSIPGLFATGDGAGIAGQAPASVSGALVACAAALDHGVEGRDAIVTRQAVLRRHLARLQPFARAIANMMRLRPEQVASIPPQTIVCRCEDVRREEIDIAIAEGAVDLNQLKHFTRCGMGPCQGRMCGEVAAELLALHRGSREDAGSWTARVPLRPVSLEDIIGAFAYDDIPIPPPAAL